MHPFAEIQSLIEEQLRATAADRGWALEGVPLGAITVEPPRDASHGDMASNAAMVLAKPLGLPPRAIAEALVERLHGKGEITSADIAGPGFINLRLSPAFWQRHMLAILDEGIGYGTSGIGKGVRVNVEYVSANPTGPMHVGHARGAVVGDALASLLVKAGYDVTREYYINDAGSQVQTLLRSSMLRYREALGEDIGDIPEGYYPGEYLIPVGEGIKAEFGDSLRDIPEDEALPKIRDLVLTMTMDMIRKDLADLGVKHDVFISEHELTRAGRVEEVLKKLDDEGLIYVGVLEPPKGKEPEDWEPRPQTLFKATQFGDDVDRALKKSDGSWTYFAPDIAYHYDKLQRGFDLLVDVFGADHAGYVKRITSAVKALSGGKVPLEVKLSQLVKFMRRGEPVKMSKRKGTFITVREVLDEVGKDVLRFIMLTRKNDAHLDFDLEQVQEQSKENPVFYVQYAHARACSAQRLAAEQVPGWEGLQAGPQLLKRLETPQELALVQLLTSWPRTVEQAAKAFEPHRVAYYAQEVAAAFHSLWNAGNAEAGLRFVQAGDKELTAARMALVQATRNVLASALHTLGVTPVEEMR